MSSPSIVKLARIGDEAKIFDFFVLAHEDNGMFKISSKKVIDKIMACCRHEGGSIGLITDSKGNIEAASGLMLDCLWYSDVWFLTDLLNYVAPDHRRSGHAKALLQFQEDTAIYLSRSMGYKIPFIPGILTRKRLEPKVKLFQRKYPQIGALFGFNMDLGDDYYNQERIEKPKFHDPSTTNIDLHGIGNATRRKDIAAVNGLL